MAVNFHAAAHRFHCRGPQGRPGVPDRVLETEGGIEVVGSADSENAAADWLVHHGTTSDLLITDLLLLPGGSGFGLVSLAKSLGKFDRVVVFSDFVTPAVAVRCLQLGADAVFNKSELSDLLSYVRDLRDAVTAGI